jgi:hypothetical protein
MTKTVIDQLRDLANLLERQNTASDYKSLREIKRPFPFWVQEDDGGFRLVLSYDSGKDSFSFFVPDECRIFSGLSVSSRKFKPVNVIVVKE